MEENKLIAKIAHLYYMENKDLKEIGKIFNVSYATISRLLKKGRTNNIIKIIINSPFEKEVQLEAELKKQLGLEEVFSVRVEDNFSYDNILNLLGMETARYLSSILKDGDNLGISWGNTIYNVVNNLKGTVKKKVNLIQLQGQMSWYRPIELTSFDLIRRMKNQFSGSFHFINSEALVDDEETKNILMRSEAIKNTFKLHETINVALLSVGVFDPYSTNFYYKDYLKSTEIEELVKKRIIGETIFKFFDSSGNICKTRIHNRAICIRTEDLVKIENKILVAGGLRKVNAILGAIRAGLVDTLIIDSLCLKKMLQLLKKNEDGTSLASKG